MASRYKTALGEEGEFESGSRGRVLKNLLAIKSKREMDRVEDDALFSAEKCFRASRNFEHGYYRRFNSGNSSEIFGWYSFVGREFEGS